MLQAHLLGKRHRQFAPHHLCKRRKFFTVRCLYLFRHSIHRVQYQFAVIHQRFMNCIQRIGDIHEELVGFLLHGANNVVALVPVPFIFLKPRPPLGI